MDVDQKTIGRRVRDARKAKGLSQDRLGLAVGAGKTAIQKIERGDHETSVVRMALIAAALERSLDDLVGIAPPVPHVPAAAETNRADSPLEEWFSGLPIRLQRAMLGAALAYEQPEISAALREQLLGRPPKRTTRRRGGAGRSRKGKG